MPEGLSAPRCTPVRNRLTGRVAVVSGGASGIGRATCARLVAEGARVVAADRDEARGRETVAALGDAAVFEPLDVTRRESWDPVIDRAVSEFGGLDILVNCAGIVAEGTVEDTTLAAWQHMLAVNVDGSFFGCQAAIAAMKERGGGAIVNLSSVSGLQGSPTQIAYNASKGAVRAMSKEIAIYCGHRGYGIRCNSVHPGVVDTPMVRRYFEAAGKDEEAVHREWVTGQAIKRMAAPEEIAGLIAFLVSMDASFATGAEFVIDGGATAGDGRAFE